MRVLIFTDSLGLPREKPEKVIYNDTWTSLLKKKLNKESDFYQLSLGGGVLREFVRQVEYLKLFKPDIVILQLGIVDCAPRALTQFENEFINKFSFTRKLGKKIIPRIKGLLRKRGISYTSKQEYREMMKKLINNFNCEVFCLGIVPASNEYEKQLPGVSNKIDEYNAILKEVFKNNFISLDEVIKVDGVMTDHIHLNKEGHFYIYKNVMNKIPLVSNLK